MRWLYLHGFASGPASRKGTEIRAHLRGRADVQLLDMRVPSFEHLRLSEGVARARAAIGEGPAIVMGSSLGGLTAARAAEGNPGVVAAVLLAPAFQLARRWAERDPAQLRRWRETGWLEVDDHTTGGRARVDYGFFEDALAADVGWPDLRVPTLVIHGTRDAVVTPGSSRVWAAERPNVTLVEVDDEHELTASIPRICREVDLFLGRWLD
ncbi:MAG: YqiA/YcfP family alpha/beta fold hydrolase [Myxococcota bacterium]